MDYAVVKGLIKSNEIPATVIFDDFVQNSYFASCVIYV